MQELPQTAFSSETEDQQLAPAVQLLDLNKVVSSTYNPRKDFRSETLQELADSIRQVGVLQPIASDPKRMVSRLSMANGAIGPQRWRG